MTRLTDPMNPDVYGGSTEPTDETAQQPDAAGDVVFYGIGKLLEEMGELGQLLGKAISFPDCAHPDGLGPVRLRLPDELADVYAALDYFVERNGLGSSEMDYRRAEKLYRFRKWGLTGIPANPDNDRSR